MCANTNSHNISNNKSGETPSDSDVDEEKPQIVKDYYTQEDHDVYQKLHSEIMDDLEEEMELDLEDLFDEQVKRDGGRTDFDTAEYKRFRRFYFKELRQLQIELVKMQDWIQATGYKLAVIFEGRDAAGKGGVIKRFMQRLNPRICRTVALPAPSDREKTQWYFQRYVPHLPAGGEIVLFDRSWYNRAGVESVMGFATSEQVDQFFNDVPLFEQLLVNSGIKLVKYWFSIEDEEQEWRFQSRILDPLKQWKLSPMDLQSRIKWEDYTKAKERNFELTNFPYARWNVIQANDKKHARLNCIRHLLDQVPYERIDHEKIVLPSRVHHEDYVRTPVPNEMKVPNYYTDI